MTTSGVEPATVRFAALRFNHLRYELVLEATVSLEIWNPFTTIEYNIRITAIFIFNAVRAAIEIRRFAFCKDCNSYMSHFFLAVPSPGYDIAYKQRCRTLELLTAFVSSSAEYTLNQARGYHSSISHMLYILDQWLLYFSAQCKSITVSPICNWNWCAFCTNYAVKYARLEVFTAVAMKNCVLWNVTPRGYRISS
jgi:hypothetical protein